MPLPPVSEVVPAAGGAVALAEIGFICILIVALGMTYLAEQLTRLIFGAGGNALGHIPIAGKWFRKGSHAIEQRLTNILGSAERKVDSWIGYTWHNLALVVRWMGRELESLGRLALVAASVLALGITPKEALKIIRALLHPIRLIQAIERRLLRLLRTSTIATKQAVGTVVLPRIGAIAHELDHVIEWDIPRLRARDRAIARRVQRAFDWIKAHEKIVVTGAFVGAVAVALGRLGIGWARCRNWRRIGKHVCGLPFGLIDGLLTLALGFELLVDPEEIAKVALAVETEFESVIEKIAA